MNMNAIEALYTNQMVHLGTIKGNLKGKRYITQEEYSKVTDTFLEVASSIQEQLLVLLGASLIYQQSEQTKNDFKDIFEKLGFDNLETLKAATDALHRYVVDINDAIEDIRKTIPRFREDHEVYMEDHTRSNPLTRSCTYYSDNLQDPGLIDPIFNILTSVAFSDFEIRVSAGKGLDHYYYKLGDRVDVNLATFRGIIAKYLGKAGKRLMKLEGRITGMLPGTNNINNFFILLFLVS